MQKNTLIANAESLIIHESRHSKVEWIEQGSIVRKTFTGFIRAQELKDAFTAGLNTLKAKRGSKWLSDNRGLPVYTQEDVKWINEVWLPQMLKNGWKYWAVLEPESLFGQASMKNFLDFYQQQGIELHVVHTMEEAISWLRSK